MMDIVRIVKLEGKAGMVAIIVIGIAYFIGEVYFHIYRGFPWPD